MNVTLIGLGCGSVRTLTGEARAALEQTGIILGAPRLLEGLPFPLTEKVPAITAEEILNALRERNRDACVVFSGDTGFYSGAKGLLPLLREAGFSSRVFPGISSLQYLAARLQRPWQDWRLCSAHGTDCDPVGEVCWGKPVFFLTGGKETPQSLCRKLTDAGLGSLAVTVGQRLSYPEEEVLVGNASDFAQRTFAPLSVLLAEAPPRPKRRAPGLPDGAFLRGNVPMTKQLVRGAVLSRLAVEEEDLCWDIGGGTGSVSVELALHCREVWSVEQRKEACALIRQNRERFAAWNLRLREGSAPETLEGLPVPDAVFIGGSSGKLEEILTFLAQRAPKARVCVSALALETVHIAVTALTALGYETEAVQLAVSQTKPAGALHLLTAQNPVFLITGRKL